MDTVIDCVDADLERLVRGGERGKIHIEVYIVWVEQDRLPQRIDSLVRFVEIFMGRGRQLERYCIWIGLHQRLQRGERLL